MTSHWWPVSFLIIPGLFGLVLLMNWLETVFTHQQVADEVAMAWQSIESVDDLERKVGMIVARVMSDAR